MKLVLAKGATSVSVDVFIQDSSSTTGAGLAGLQFNTSGLVAHYKRPRAAWTAITLVTQTVTGAWSSGGFVENGVVTGSYRLDIPNAAFAAGVDQVQVALFGATNMAPVLLEVQLSDFNLNTAAPNVTATNTVTATVASSGISSASFQPGAIDANAIGTNAIQAAKIQNDAITSSKIQAGAITASQIAAGAITAAKFDAAAITSTVLADNCVTQAKLDTNAISSAKIASGAIGVSQVADGALTSAKFNTGFIQASSFAPAAIDAAAIATDAIQAAKIQNAAITSAKLAPAAIEASNIGAGALTAAKFGSDYPQSIRNAMRLAGTGAAPALNSIDDKIDDVYDEVIAAQGEIAYSANFFQDRRVTIGTLGAQTGLSDPARQCLFPGSGTDNRDFVGAELNLKRSTAPQVQVRRIIAYDAATRIATVDQPWHTNPTAGDTPAVFMEAGRFQSQLAEWTGSYLRFKATALEQAPVSGAGLTAQDVRDAMKLAPTAGSPDFGSIDQELDTANAGISTTIAAVAAQNDLSAQQVRDAMKLDASAGAPAAGSIDEHLDDLVADGDLTLLEEGTVGNQAGVAANELKLKQSGFGTINPIGAFLFHEAADGFKQARKILAWNSGDRIVTVDRDWYTQPTSGTYYVRGAFLSLTPQETRDTMKLAPSAGAPANDSVDDRLKDTADATAFLTFREQVFYTPKITAIETSANNAATFAAGADVKAGKVLGLIDEGSLPFQSGVTDPNTQVKLDTTAPSLAASLTGCTVTVLTTPPQQRKITSYDDINKIVDIDQPWAQNPGQGTAYRVTLDTHAMLGQQASLLIGDKVEAELTTPYTSTANPTSLQGRMKRHDDLLEAGAGYNRYKATALEQAPSGGGGGANGFDELLNTTVQTVTSQTVWTLAAGPSNANALIGCMIVRSKPDGRISINRITGWAGGNQITVEATPNLTVEVGDTVKVVAKMPGESLTTEQVAAAIWGQTAATYQAQGTFGHTVGNSGANTSTIYSRVHALNDLTQQQVTDACDDALQNFNGPTVNDIATATRTEIDANGLGSQVIRSVTITQVTDAQNFRIDTPINGIADRFQRIAIVGKKTNARNPAVGRVISTVDTDGDVVANAPYPEAFQVGDQAVLVGYYLV